MKVLFVLSLVVTLMGCVAPIYYEPSLSSSKPLAERQKDAVECGAIAGQTLMGYPHAIDPAALRLTLERRCLQSRGWE